jgi:hypothetical protein
MKTIGLLGGMSWESTQLYCRLINEGVKAKLGGLHSARIALVSVDFHNEWKKATNGRKQRIKRPNNSFLPSIRCSVGRHNIIRIAYCVFRRDCPEYATRNTPQIASPNLILDTRHLTPDT